MANLHFSYVASPPIIAVKFLALKPTHIHTDRRTPPKMFINTQQTFYPAEKVQVVKKKIIAQIVFSQP